jgi:hypothetical protein
MSTFQKIDSPKSSIDIDNVAFKFGLVRGDKESIKDFKRRVLSLFTHSSSLTDQGISATLARAFNTRPYLAGYIDTKLNPDVAPTRINFDGYTLMAESGVGSRPSPGGTLYTKLTAETSITDSGSFLELDNIARYEIIDPRFNNKKLLSMLPFKNYEDDLSANVRPGVNRLPHRNIAPDSFISDSVVIRNRKSSIREVLSAGDYYYDGVDKLIIYDSSTFGNIQVSYSVVHRYIPIYYCPVKVVSAYKILQTMASNVETASSVIPVSDSDIDILWDIFVTSKTWKSNQTSPISANGTFYAS